MAGEVEAISEQRLLSLLFDGLLYFPSADVSLFALI